MDPWGNAAAQYNQGLGQLAQINQQGYQAQAQGPASIYDRFLQGYVQAKQMRMQEEAAKREAEFKQQQLDIQRQRWQQEDQQVKLRETAKIQTAMAQNYRKELRGSYAAELKAINPEWDDKKVDSILPPQTPETIQIDGNAPLPLMPNDPVTLKNPAMRDDFLGLNPLKEKNDAEQFQIAEQRRAATQAALDADRKADNARAERLAEQRHQEFLASTRNAANAQANTLAAIAARADAKGGEKLKPIPASRHAAILENEQTVKKIEDAIKLLEKNPGAVGPKHLLRSQAGGLAGYLMDRKDPEGVAVRQAIQEITNLRLHELSGAAVTLNEDTRFKPVLAQITEDPENAIVKLRKLLSSAYGVRDGLREMYSEGNGYRPNSALGGSPSPAPSGDPGGMKEGQISASGKYVWKGGKWVAR